MLQNDRVKVVKGEHEGATGTVLRQIPRRYRAEDVIYQIRLDGFPIPGGWDGKVYITEVQIKRIEQVKIDWEKISREKAVGMLQLAWITLHQVEYTNMTETEANLYNVLTRFEK